jgi:RNA polymerase II subunit A small phosphatase-like protein
LPPQPAHLAGRKTLVLDLDETLVHSQFDEVKNSPPDYTIPVEIDNKTCKIFVQKRPGAEYFLEEMAKYYEVVIFTASLSKYADPLMD